MPVMAVVKNILRDWGSGQACIGAHCVAGALPSTVYYDVSGRDERHAWTCLGGKRYMPVREMNDAWTGEARFLDGRS